MDDEKKVPIIAARERGQHTTVYLAWGMFSFVGLANFIPREAHARVLICLRD